MIRYAYCFCTHGASGVKLRALLCPDLEARRLEGKQEGHEQLICTERDADRVRFEVQHVCECACGGGYRESEIIVMCTYASYEHALMIPFRVKSCSNYEDRTKPSWLQMQKLAIPVSDVVRKPAGFLGERGLGKKADEDE